MKAKSHVLALKFFIIQSGANIAARLKANDENMRYLMGLPMLDYKEHKFHIKVRFITVTS